MEPTDKPIHWAIKEIKELEFFVNEFLDVGQTFDFNYQVEIIPIIADEQLLLSIAVNYIKKDTKEIFMRGRVVTVYLIKDLKMRTSKHADNKDTVDLPDNLWIALFSIAFSHARAIFSRSTAGTKYSHLLLPVINPEAEFKKLFGHLMPQKTP